MSRPFPGDDGVRQRIARALANEGDLANALKRYDDLAKGAKSPNDRIVFALRAADLRMQLGQKEQATKDLETLLAQLRPGSYLYAEGVVRSLCDLYLRSNRLDQLISRLEIRGRESGDRRGTIELAVVLRPEHELACDGLNQNDALFFSILLQRPLENASTSDEGVS